MQQILSGLGEVLSEYVKLLHKCNAKKYPIPNSMDALEQFVNDLLDNKLEAYMKSEPVPDNSDKDVKVLFVNRLKFCIPT